MMVASLRCGAATTNAGSLPVVSSNLPRPSIRAHAVRSIEETGIKVRVERLSGVYQNMPRGIVALVFRCSPVGGRLTTTDEALSVRWLSIDQIQQHMDPAYVVRVTDAFSEGAPARVHDGIDLVHA